MGTALSVFEISNVDKKFQTVKYLDTTFWSKKIDSFAIDVKGNPSPDIQLERKKILKESKITHNGIKVDNNRLITKLNFKVTHLSEIHKDHVRVFVSETQEPKELFLKYKYEPNRIHLFKGGYQKVVYYDAIFDFNNLELFLFTTKDVAKNFVSVFKKIGALDYKQRMFNLEKVPSIPEIQNIFGAWEDVTDANVSIKGLFGTQIHKSKEIKLEDVNSWNLEWSNGNQVIKDLFINKKCRLSSRSNIENRELLGIYYRLKEYVGFKS